MSITPEPAQPTPEEVAAKLRKAADLIVSTGSTMPVNAGITQTLAAMLQDQADAADEHTKEDFYSDGLCPGELKAYEFARAVLGETP